MQNRKKNSAATDLKLLDSSHLNGACSLSIQGSDVNLCMGRVYLSKEHA